MTRIIYALAKTGALDDPGSPDRNAFTDVTSPEHIALARYFATQSAVLLKNDNHTLPLNLSDAKTNGKPFRVAVIGTAGNGTGAIYGGGGSGAVVPKHAVSVVEAFSKDSRFSVTHSAGDNKHHVAKLVAAADIGIVVLAQTSQEGKDRVTLELPQSDVVKVAASNDQHTPVVVITITPGPYLLDDWIDDVAAVIDMGMPGEQEGSAVVDLLAGDVNPSGKMTHTTPHRWNEMNMTTSQYPGSKPTNTPPACTTTPVPAFHFQPCSPYEANYSEVSEEPMFLCEHSVALLGAFRLLSARRA